MPNRPMRAGLRATRSRADLRLRPPSEGGIQDIGLMRDLQAIECGSDLHRSEVFSSIALHAAARRPRTKALDALGRRLAAFVRRHLDATLL
jgi:hypothetical protein